MGDVSLSSNESSDKAGTGDEPGIVPESAPFDDAIGHQRQEHDSEEVAPHVEWHDENSGETVEAVTKNRKVKRRSTS